MIYSTEYGNVVEMRINRNTAGPKTPFFGFIVFDKPEPVQDLLFLKKKQVIGKGFFFFFNVCNSIIYL